jgi:Zc3h12a-like ribonuclease protein
MPQKTQHVIVDGSNIATEGRSMPSLAQLDEAVRAFMAEFPDAQITVVVDATFGHRIPNDEVAAFDEAVANAEIVSPPAGAFGRGDAFLLRIAEKVDADVLSNDSFQEFHGEHEWLFDRGRLIGGKPVPGIGWIFTARSPVRGPKSREAIRRAGRSPAVDQAIKTATDEATATPRKRGTRGGRGRRAEPTERGPDTPKVGDGRLVPLTAEEKEKSEADRRRRRGQVPSDPVNEPMVFLGFVASHRPGTTVDGTVEEFTSHGAFVRVGEARCYLPLGAMGDPPPRAARDAVTKGETRSFMVQAFDPPRRGIEIAIPEFAKVSGAPSEETVEQEINATKKAPARKKAAAATKETAVKKAPAKRGAAAAKKLLGVPDVAQQREEHPAEPKVKKTAVKKAAAPRKTAVKKAAAPKEAAVKKAAAPKKAAAKKEAAPKKTAAAKKAAAKKKA